MSVEFLVYLKRKGRWQELARYVEQIGVPCVLDVSHLDTSRSPITTAVEIEDALLESRIDALALPRVGVSELDWYIMLADALGTTRLVIPPAPTIDDIAAVYDRAVGHGMHVNWIYGIQPLASIDDVERVAREVRHTAARITYDPVKARGTKEIYKTIVALSGYIREIYMSNRRGGRSPRLPPFDPSGRVNFAEIMQILHLIGWEGKLTIRQAPAYFSELEVQIKIGMEVLESTKSSGASKVVRRRVSAILAELMSRGAP